MTFYLRNWHLQNQIKPTRVLFSHINFPWMCRIKKKKKKTPHISSANLFFWSLTIQSWCFRHTQASKENKKGLLSWFGPKKKKLCWGFQHSTTLQESSVFVGRAKRGRYHLADHMWSSSKTLREPVLVRFNHRAAYTGPRGLTVQRQHRGRLSPRAISGAQCSLCPTASIYLYVCTTCARSHVYMRIVLLLFICLELRFISKCVCVCVFVCKRVPRERAWQACVLQSACQAYPAD